MKNFRLLPIAAIVAATLAACGSTPSGDSPLARARSDFSAAQADPQVASLAAAELGQARSSLDKANRAAEKREKDSVVDHLAYVTTQHVAIARETAAQKSAELAVANAGAERDRVRLDARTREADAATASAQASQRSAQVAQADAEAAERNARISQRQSDRSRRNADASQRDSEASQRQSEASQRQSEASQRQAEASQRSAQVSQDQASAERLAAAEAQRGADAARLETRDAEGRARRLEEQLAAMEARKTERGMVVTLGDVLFDTNLAQLKPGGVRSLQRLADFFNEYPQRTVMIEGFTDSVGAAGHNQELSDERAASVRTALLGMGIASGRITARGYGEAHPVADNATLSGRQLNRRVEMVVSDEQGNITPR